MPFEGCILDFCELHISAGFMSVWIEVALAPSTVELKLAVVGSLIFGIGKLSSKASSIESLTDHQALNSASKCKTAMLNLKATD